MTPLDRPRFLDLRKIRLPLPALVSIVHRVSGFLLFLFLPLLLYCLEASLGSEAGFGKVAAFFSFPLAKLAALGLLWALFFHFFAGIRHFFLDLHYGVALRDARRSSRWVILASVLTTLVLGVKLW